MPIATPKQFAQMLDAAQQGGYAYPAINCTSIITLNAVMRAFAEQKSDGIIQFSTGAGGFASGTHNKNQPYGCIVLAEAAHLLAEQYNVLVALNTDHCQPKVAAEFLDPLLEATATGLPMITTDVGGNAEIVREGRSGWLEPAGNPVAFSEALNRVLGDADAGERMGAYARAWAEAHGSLRSMAARYEALYGVEA